MREWFGPVGSVADAASGHVLHAGPQSPTTAMACCRFGGGFVSLAPTASTAKRSAQPRYRRGVAYHRSKSSCGLHLVLGLLLRRSSKDEPTFGPYNAQSLPAGRFHCLYTVISLPSLVGLLPSWRASAGVYCIRAAMLLIPIWQRPPR